MSCTPSAKDLQYAKELKDYLDDQFQKLDEKIQRGVWKSNSNTLQQLVDTFVTLTVNLGGGYLRKIGTEEFWLAVYNAANSRMPLELQEDFQYDE